MLSASRGNLKEGIELVHIVEIHPTGYSSCRVSLFLVIEPAPVPSDPAEFR